MKINVKIQLIEIERSGVNSGTPIEFTHETYG